MSALRLELLGDLQIRSEKGPLAIVSAKKAQALLAYLAVKPAQRVSREKIAALLWSSTGPDQARQSLRQTLSMLRKRSEERRVGKEGRCRGGAAQEREKRGRKRDRRGETGRQEVGG